MDFADRIRELANRIPQQLPHIKTEEATKNALVMPFISALGYNVFDPFEVTPELDADVGVKKGEKVDYAILKDGKPIMLFECKPCNCSLDECHASQLYRYFSVTDARLGVLTNGVAYRFFSDLEAPNKMDSRPFLEVDLRAVDDLQLAELKKFSRSSFEIGSILANASDLKYTREIKRILAQEMNQPSEEFVRFFTTKVYPGRMTQHVREQFAEITKKALQQFVSEKVSDRLKSALAQEQESVQPESPEEAATTAEPGRPETTEEEMQGFYIVRAILAQVVDPARVVMRDQKSYCSILLDDSNRKPICRLWFNGAQKYVGVFDAEKNETRVPLGNLVELYRLSNQLREAVTRYEAKGGVGDAAAAAGGS
ncbi:MAG TPA: type I restriction endonuclease [Thermoanaerobaculia bacterium]|nr:type I restriction endonuclease [Thermoanaerobaculia bacterium]